MVTGQHGATPLHYAVQVGALQTVKLLIKYKVDVNATDSVISDVVLYMQIRVKTGVTINKTNLHWQDGWTPLHISIQTRNRDIVKVLLVNGADKTRKNKVKPYCCGL